MLGRICNRKSFLPLRVLKALFCPRSWGLFLPSLSDLISGEPVEEGTACHTESTKEISPDLPFPGYLPISLFEKRGKAGA